MAEYIDREAVFAEIDNMHPKPNLIIVRERLANIPAADVVEVVMCKDCVNFIDEGRYSSYCGYHTNNACDGGYCDGACYVKENDFCSYGARKGDCNNCNNHSNERRE